MMQVKDIVKKIFLGINIAFVFLFLLSCLAPFISPRIITLPAILGLGFPFLVIVNVLWVIFWLLFKRGFALISLLALVLGSWNISNQFSYARCREVHSDGKSFSVMSFNVKVFDLYSWTQNINSKDDILKIIENANPDILCLQEFYSDEDQFNTLAVLKKRYPYFQFHQTLTIEETHHWGIVTFSKFPIVNEDVIPFSNSMHNVCIAADVLIGKDTVRLFNAHLQSFYFDQQDYEGAKNLMERHLKKVPFWKILGKFRDAFFKRAYQVDLVKQHIDASPYKVMVCADFNDTPNSYTYRQLSENLTDSFKEAGCGFGLTFTAPTPFLRIDYILVDKSIPVLYHKAQWNQSSDHFSVLGRFGMNSAYPR